MQPRVSKGVRTGGQWKTQARDDEVDDLGAEPVEPEWEVPEPHKLTFPQNRLPHFVKAIEAANRRLERNGVDERFSFTKTERTVPVKGPDGNVRAHIPCYDVEMNQPRIKLGDYQVAARIDTLEDGSLVAMSAPGTELHGWVPEDLSCDQCHTNRQRNNVYVLDGPDGDRHVVGSTCLEVYTGVKPQGLWVLTESLADDFDESGQLGDPDEKYLGSSGGTPVEDVDRTLTAAIAVAEIQGGYRRTGDDHGSTRDAVMAALHPNMKLQAEIDWSHKVADQSRDVDLDQFKTDLDQALGDADSDWAINVRALTRQEHVTHRHVGTLVSAISAVDRYRAKKRETATIASGYIADVDAKIDKKNPVQAKVLRMNYQTAYINGYARNYAWVRMQTDDGHIMTWKASSEKALNEMEEGQSIRVTGGTVKGHDRFNNEDQTVMTRLKYEIADQN